MNIEIFDSFELNIKFNHMVKSTLNIEETLDYLIDKKLSVARYGDGEIKMTNNLKGCMFESSSYYGTHKLRTILSENHEKLLVCIPGKQHDSWWSIFWKEEFERFSSFLSTKIYGNSFVSRSAFREMGINGVNKWKKVWQNRKVVFITGEGSRFNFEHSLFDNLNNYDILLSKATHAIQDIPRITYEVSKYDKETLFLIALGPAATILSYELTLMGYQAIDIGHITNCYDAVFHNAVAPEKLPVKNNW